MRGAWRWHNDWLYLLCYWRTREQLTAYARSYGASLQLNLWATKHVALLLHFGRRAVSVQIGLRYQHKDIPHAD